MTGAKSNPDHKLLSNLKGYCDADYLGDYDSMTTESLVQAISKHVAQTPLKRPSLLFWQSP